MSDERGGCSTSLVADEIVCAASDLADHHKCTLRSWMRRHSSKAQVSPVERLHEKQLADAGAAANNSDGGMQTPEEVTSPATPLLAAPAFAGALPRAGPGAS